jgi:hypothetical protein
MNPAQEFSALLDQWRQLSEEEGTAISSGAWTHVEHFQSAKTRLQPRITEVTQRIDASIHEKLFRPMLDELMQLERRNNSLLEQKRSAAQEQERSLDRTQRNLRQIHKSYTPKVRTHWHSYS